MFSLYSSIPSMLDELDKLTSKTFYHAPESGSKPPWQSTVHSDDRNGKVDYCELYVALAGVAEDDVSVSFEDNTLMIHVDNTSKSNTIPPKFIFDNKPMVFEYNSTYDLSKAEVKLENGLLIIKVPVKEKKKTKNLLFGKK